MSSETDAPFGIAWSIVQMTSPFDRWGVIDLVDGKLDSLREGGNTYREPNPTLVHAMKRILKHIIHVRNVQVGKKPLAARRSRIGNQDELERCWSLKDVNIVLRPFDKVHAARLKRTLIGRYFLRHAAEAKEDTWKRDVEVWISTKLADSFFCSKDVLVDLLTRLVNNPQQVHNHFLQEANNKFEMRGLKLSMTSHYQTVER